MAVFYLTIIYLISPAFTFTTQECIIVFVWKGPVTKYDELLGLTLYSDFREPYDVICNSWLTCIINSMAVYIFLLNCIKCWRNLTLTTLSLIAAINIGTCHLADLDF